MSLLIRIDIESMQQQSALPRRAIAHCRRFPRGNTEYDSRAVLGNQELKMLQIRFVVKIGRYGQALYTLRQLPGIHRVFDDFIDCIQISVTCWTQFYLLRIDVGICHFISVIFRNAQFICQRKELDVAAQAI